MKLAVTHVDTELQLTTSVLLQLSLTDSHISLGARESTNVDERRPRLAEPASGWASALRVRPCLFSMT